MLSPDIGVSEMLVVAAVALIVVGPKDLPLLMRRVGQFIAKLRGMASEFRASFEDMARQSELEELRKEVEAMRSGNFTPNLHDPSVDQVFADIESGLKSGNVSLSPAMTIDNAVEAVEPAAEPAPKPARKPRAKPAAKVEAAAPAPAPAKAPAKRKTAAKKAAEPAIVDPPKRKRTKSEIVS
jgi:sec-independent protein translocase protein TatB